MCTVVINDDQVFENFESFSVELSMPVYALLGQVTRTRVNINDTEDEPTLQFDKKTYHVNESSVSVSVPVERKGASVSPYDLHGQVTRYFWCEFISMLSQVTPAAPSPPCATPSPGRPGAAASTPWSPAPTTRAVAWVRRTA